MRSVAGATFLALVLSHAPALAQDDAGEPKGKARITGRVLAADSGAPLPRAQVVLRNGTRGFQRTALTDPQGRYDITGLPADRYTLTASKNGYLTLAYGQRRPSEAGRPIAIADAQTLDRVDFPLPKSSVIVVRVSDEFGEPVVGATIKVERYGYANGQGGSSRPGRPSLSSRLVPTISDSCASSRSHPGSTTSVPPQEGPAGLCSQPVRERCTAPRFILERPSSMRRSR